MKVLVTGGAGFIGFHLISALLKEGHDVVCVDNLNEYYDPALKRARLKKIENKIEFHKTDISDQDALESIFKRHRFDKICHLAAQAGVRYSLENPFSYGISNYMGTLNVFEFAKRYKVPHVVYASTSSVYSLNKEMPYEETQRTDTPITIYAASKKSGELMGHVYHHLFGLDVTCLRFFTVYGPYGRPDMALFKFTKNILEGKPIDVYNNGDMMRDFTFVDDIVQGFVLAMNKPMGFEIFNLGCGNPVGLMDYIKAVEAALGKKAEMNMMGMQPGDVKATSADITKARKVLGFEPKTMVPEGVKKFVEWYREYHRV